MAGCISVFYQSESLTSKTYHFIILTRVIFHAHAYQVNGILVTGLIISIFITLN